MKWRNKGHELDSYAERLLDMFDAKKRKIYIFGAGIIGGELVLVFERFNCFAGYIDNDVDKQTSGINGRRVISLKHYIENEDSGMVIVAADEKNIPSIEGQLKSVGLDRGADFWVYTDFMQDVFPVISVYGFNVLFVDVAQICVTERCTLKCRDCAHGCFAVAADSMDMGVERLKKSADSFFAKVDLVKEFVLIGGEPFLYGSLDEAIEYIGENYRDKIITFSITTNGTIIPGEGILELCRKYGMVIRISNYSGTIKRLEKKYERLASVLCEYGVAHYVGKSETQWMDYGFRHVNHGGGETEMIRTFDGCRTPCREIRGSRYYYCVMARSVSDNLKIDVGNDDYLDLDELDARYKKIFLEFNHGYSEKGYLDMCNYCHGADCRKHPIPAAIQVET